MFNKDAQMCKSCQNDYNMFKSCRSTAKLCEVFDQCEIIQDHCRWAQTFCRSVSHSCIYASESFNHVSWSFSSVWIQWKAALVKNLHSAVQMTAASNSSYAWMNINNCSFVHEEIDCCRVAHILRSAQPNPTQPGKPNGLREKISKSSFL